MVFSLKQNKYFDSSDYDQTHNYQKSLVYINIIIAFTASLAGLLMYRSHLISSLLCLEEIILSLFIIATLIILNSHFTLTSIMSIILLVFTACEAALGLSLLVMVGIHTVLTTYKTLTYYNAKIYCSHSNTHTPDLIIKKHHGIWSHHFMGNRWRNRGNSVRLFWEELQIHCRWRLQPWN